MLHTAVGVYSCKICPIQEALYFFNHLCRIIPTETKYMSNSSFFCNHYWIIFKRGHTPYIYIQWISLAAWLKCFIINISIAFFLHNTSNGSPHKKVCSKVLNVLPLFNLSSTIWSHPTPKNAINIKGKNCVVKSKFAINVASKRKCAGKSNILTWQCHTYFSYVIQSEDTLLISHTVSKPRLHIAVLNSSSSKGVWSISTIFEAEIIGFLQQNSHHT